MRVFQLWSRYDEILDFTEDGEADYLETAACSTCHGPSAAWRQSPWPVHVEIEGPPRGAVARVWGFPFVLHARLADVLRPYLPDALFGSVTIGLPRAADPEGPWVTCVPDRDVRLYSHRGENCRHVICVGGCGAVGNVIGWADDAIVRRDVDGRWCFFDNYHQLFVTDDLLRTLNLRRRFPDLRPVEYPVVDEPLDGEVLPGDPGWDGIFRPRPPPDYMTSKEHLRELKARAARQRRHKRNKR